MCNDLPEEVVEAGMLTKGFRTGTWIQMLQRVTSLMEANGIREERHLDQYG